ANEDVTVWTFYLRRDVKWHDGVPFTAHDVKFTFDRILDPSENAQAHQDMKELERVEVVDDYTVRFYLRSPDGLFPDRLALGSLNPLPKHLLEQYDRLADAVDFNTRRPIGNGP